MLNLETTQTYKPNALTPFEAKLLTAEQEADDETQETLPAKEVFERLRALLAA